MVKPLDISGVRYGRLTAIKRDPQIVGRAYWYCECDCGGSVTTSLDSLRAGFTKSCGCLKVETVRNRSLKHGHSVNRRESRTLKSYNHAKSRCFNPNNPKYPHYGGRGITMCQEWASSFENFLRDMGECPHGMTLDRVNPHGHYEPRNCRWANVRQQARTRTDNILVEHDGRSLILKDFADLMGVNYKSLHRRVKYLGKTPHEAAQYLQEKCD